MVSFDGFALEFFRLAKFGNATVDEILSQQRLYSIVFTDPEIKFARTIEIGVFQKTLGDALSEVKTDAKTEETPENPLSVKLTVNG